MPTKSISLPAQGQKKTLTQVVPNTLPLLFQETKQKILVLTEDAQQAQKLVAAWQFLSPKKKAIFFPDWETLPYEHFSPHQDLVSERLSSLWQIKNQAIDVVVMPVATAMQKLVPASFISGRTFWLKVGSQLNIDVLRENLVQAGYTSVSNVVVPGEFSIRGGLIDLFPMGSEVPFRIDLFDDEIDSIKVFDPDTQRTTHPIEEIRLLPAHEFPTDEPAQKRFRQQFRENIESNPTDSVVYQAVSRGHFGSGVDYYLPLFFEEPLDDIFSYLATDAILITVGDMNQEASRVEEDIVMRYRLSQGDETYPPVAPNTLYLKAHELQAKFKAYPRIVVDTRNTTLETLPEVMVDRKKAHPLAAFDAFYQSYSGRILVCAESLGRRETMMSFLQQHHFKLTVVNDWADFLAHQEDLCLTVAPDLIGGFQLPQDKLALLTEADLYQRGDYVRAKRRKHAAVSDTQLRDLAEINIGDPVVHESHGIGRYQGLETLDMGEGDTEMMLLAYGDGASLYVPVSQLHLISRYAGSASENISLHKLGGHSWDKSKKKAMEKARDTAAELLNLYAQRAIQVGHQYVLDEEDYQAFADGFDYEETEDQMAAIVAVMKDMTSTQPMDRLICGDVGFGKTEVALRAAFLTVMNGKQVAVLAPTTLLVEQHSDVFKNRFADFPVKVEQLSRFNSGKESKAIIAGLKSGAVDIVVGTHKLIQPDIEFESLGLVIIDEEHRFGVRQKEALKRLRSNVDVLTLTATPIPRTLSMALEGLRDFSLITTPPSRRLSVKTLVKPFTEAIIREALLRELKRGGQVFFLHNEVETIENMRERLATLVPEARIAVAHGQLHPRALEEVMRQFARHQFNILLCSTIIETGIDIPNANTIIINRADKFGLAQLHQLRGRVGRSFHQAYAYLLIPEYITKDAEKRLDAISNADALGAGFTLAMQDLEIRGAGEILGDGQSGEIVAVGLTLYGEMLKQAVRDLKKGKVPDVNAPLGVNTEIKLHAPALLPERYCPDIHARLVLYKRLAACEEIAAIRDINEELVDRFGLPDEVVTTLLESHVIRLMAKTIGVDKLDATQEAITLSLGKDHILDPVAIITLIQQDRQYQLAGQDKIKVLIASETIESRIRHVKMVLKTLAPNKLKDY